MQRGVSAWDKTHRSATANKFVHTYINTYIHCHTHTDLRSCQTYTGCCAQRRGGLQPLKRASKKQPHAIDVAKLLIPMSDYMPAAGNMQDSLSAFRCMPVCVCSNQYARVQCATEAQQLGSQHPIDWGPGHQQLHNRQPSTRQPGNKPMTKHGGTPCIDNTNIA